MLNSNKTIGEIAYELGFNYPPHLIRLFKQRVGYTPNDYRRLNLTSKYTIAIDPNFSLID